MEKLKFLTALSVTCILTAAIGIMLGFFVLGPIGVSATTAKPAVLSTGKPEYVSLYTPPATAAEYTQPEAQEHDFPADNFIVSSKDGYIVVYYAGEIPEIKEITFTPINALPVEEQERLAEGIYIYTEEALVRILEDYGS